MPRVSAELGYQRRWLINFTATDNRNVGSNRLHVLRRQRPDGSATAGWRRWAARRALQHHPEANTRVTDNFVTLADRFGELDAGDPIRSALNVTARPRFGLTMQGGFNYATNRNDYCEVEEADSGMDRGAQSPTNRGATTSMTARATALGSYTVPKIDVQVAVTFRSEPGGQLAAN